MSFRTNRKALRNSGRINPLCLRKDHGLQQSNKINWVEEFHIPLNYMLLYIRCMLRNERSLFVKVYRCCCFFYFVSLINNPIEIHWMHRIILTMNSSCHLLAAHQCGGALERPVGLGQPKPQHRMPLRKHWLPIFAPFLRFCCLFLWSNH